MGWIQLAVVAFFAVFTLKQCDDLKTATKAKAIAVVEKQIAESIADANKDAAREMAVLLGKRASRATVIKAAQAARKVQYVKDQKASPSYAAWAREPVPSLVVDELRQRTDPTGGVRGSAGDQQPGPAVQAQSPAAAPVVAQPTPTKRNLGPRLRPPAP